MVRVIRRRPELVLLWAIVIGLAGIGAFFFLSVETSFEMKFGTKADTTIMSLFTPLTFHSSTASDIAWD
jgi:hypothetical protein